MLSNLLITLCLPFIVTFYVISPQVSDQSNIQLFFLLLVVPASGLELSEESGRNCGFQRKRAFLYSSFPPTPVLSSLSSAVRRKRVFLPTVPGRLEVGAGRRRGLAGKGITATVSAIHAKHGSGRDKNWRKNLIFSDMIEKHFHKCQSLPITRKAFRYKKKGYNLSL